MRVWESRGRRSGWKWRVFEHTREKKTAGCWSMKCFPDHSLIIFAIIWRPQTKSLGIGQHCLGWGSFLNDAGSTSCVYFNEIYGAFICGRCEKKQTCTNYILMSQSKKKKSFPLKLTSNKRAFSYNLCPGCTTAGRAGNKFPSTAVVLDLDSILRRGTTH